MLAPDPRRGPVFSSSRSAPSRPRLANERVLSAPRGPPATLVDGVDGVDGLDGPSLRLLLGALYRKSNFLTFVLRYGNAHPTQIVALDAASEANLEHSGRWSS